MAEQANLAQQAGLPVALASELPLDWVEVTVAGRTWRILAVLNQDRLLDLADRLAHVPYGFLLWESAVALAQLLATLPGGLAGKRVLELGAGLGLTGLVARSLGADVWQTDHEPHLLTLAAYNAAVNQIGGIHQFVADWRSWQHTGQYDLLLGADILYERVMHPYLEPIFSRNLAHGGRLILADPSRPQALTFMAELETRGWQFDLTVERIDLPVLQRSPKPVEVALWTGRPAARRL